MGTFSISHWLIVLLVLLLVFGPKKLAGIGKGMGEGLRNFRTGLAGEAASDEPADAPKFKTRTGVEEQAAERGEEFVAASGSSEAASLGDSDRPQAG